LNGRGRNGDSGKRLYECREHPCIHVVIDRRKGIFKVFIEDYDRIIPLSFEELVKAWTIVSGEALGKKLREARNNEVDYLARKYLEAEPVEVEIEY